jgi:hypothetical protein
MQTAKKLIDPPLEGRLLWLAHHVLSATGSMILAGQALSELKIDVTV